MACTGPCGKGGLSARIDLFLYTFLHCQEFEKKSARIKARAATNLAFLYALESDVDQADKYSELALKSDRYNARAYVNKVRPSALTFVHPS